MTLPATTTTKASSSFLDALTGGTAPRRRKDANDNVRTCQNSSLSTSSSSIDDDVDQSAFNRTNTPLKTPSMIGKREKQAIDVRLLIFVEDCDGTRSNIFDSGKYTPLSNAMANAAAAASSRPPIIQTKLQQQTTTTTTTTTTTSPPPSTNKQQQPVVVVSNNFNKSALSSSKLNNEMIMRMVFGSFPMKVSNNIAIKVHSLRYTTIQIGIVVFLIV